MPVLLETQRAQIALVGGDPSRAVMPGRASRGGVGRGGGGAVPTTTDNQNVDFNIQQRDLRANVPYKVTRSDGSIMYFSTGGKIVSPVAFAIEVGGTKLTMTPAGIEIAGQSVTSPGYESYTKGISDAARVAALRRSSPELKWANTEDRGYVTVQLTRERVTANWHSVETIRARTPALKSTHSMTALRGKRVFEAA